MEIVEDGKTLGIDRIMHFSFDLKTDSDSFLEWLKKEAYKYDIVSVNEILKKLKEYKVADGGKYGFSKREIKKMKSRKVGKMYVVTFPMPSKFIRDENGYWTTESELRNKGGG